MSRTQTTRAGFTLIELTITVAIIGILAATSIALFRAQQMRAKRSEAMTNVEAIAKMERGYYGENGIYPAASLAAPAGVPGVKQNWDALARGQFSQLGYEAEGTVWFVYEVNSAAGLCACPSGGCFTATAYGNSDLDPNMAVISYFHGDGAGTVCPNLILGIGPPIDPGDGLAVLDQPIDIYTFDLMFGFLPRADDY
jgi:prepilin-type N-terminal cleavage/methylation domain-containing protein